MMRSRGAVFIPTSECSPADYHAVGESGPHSATQTRRPEIPEPTSPNPSPTTDPPELRYDLLALDLDGTLLRSDKQLSKYDAVAIKEAMRRGVKVVLATARPPRSSKPIHRKLGLDTPLINYNGAVIYDVAKDEQLYHEPLSSQTAREIIKLARSIEPSVVVSLEVQDKWYTDHDDPQFKTATARRFKPDYVGTLIVPLSRPITKLMLLFHAEKLKPVRDAIVAEFGDRAAFPESDETIVQVVHAEVNKGAALKRVADRYGIEAARVCAIGDAPNDAAMLRWAGLGLAVGNAFGEACEAANVVLDKTNDQRAVGLAVERYILGDDPVAREVARVASTEKDAQG